jgi:ATP-dependent Clp protease ATP-binding subunit ClpC
MFERYTEAARRTLFFARYETSEMGALTIEPEHLLLGLLRGKTGPARTILAGAQLSHEGAREAIDTQRAVREKTPTAVEIPFSDATKRILHYALEEADRLRHSYIGTEHLLLGLLREEPSVAASILRTHGLTLDGVRARVVQLLAAAAATSPDKASGYQRGDEIEAIKQRIDDLAMFHPDRDHFRELIARIHHHLDELKKRLG